MGRAPVYEYIPLHIDTVYPRHKQLSQRASNTSVMNLNPPEPRPDSRSFPLVLCLLPASPRPQQTP